MSYNKISKILVAIDGSDNSMKAADYAIAMAKKEGSELVVINVIHTPASALTFYGETAFREFLKKSKTEAEEWFENIRKKALAAQVQVKTEAIEDIQSIPSAIVRYAEEKKVDLIVVGTIGRTGFKKLLLGSVAQAVVTYAASPVLVIK